MTKDVPGIGGGIKARLEDFIVGEVPLYEPCGEGEHAYLEIEKRDLSTFEAVERLAKALRKDPRDFGFAGMKDRKGITRQYISISGVDPKRARELDLSQIQIRSVTLHRNKLRVGHLRGNRFFIRVHGVKATPEQVDAVLSRLESGGMPNYYGPQRFGVRGEAHAIGKSLLQGDSQAATAAILGRPSDVENNPDVVSSRYLFEQYRWAEALRRIPISYRDERRMLQYLLLKGEDYQGAVKGIRHNVFKLYLSAFQAHIFNTVLERRLAKNGEKLEEFVLGDVAFLHRNGALFTVENVEELKERAESFEISPSGPIIGSKMLGPGPGLAHEIESEVLAAENLASESYKVLDSHQLMGSRRPLRVKPEELEWELDGEDLKLTFFLPRGSYATTLLRELMKNDEVPPSLRGLGTSLS
ncbi:MAG: tRNA pseudouridine(13) synthase TruD [Planctomycetota bacterium]